MHEPIQVTFATYIAPPSDQYRSTSPFPMTWDGKDAEDASPQRKQALFPSMGERMLPRREMNFPYLESPTFLRWEILTRARGEPALSQQRLSPIIGVLCAPI